MKGCVLLWFSLSTRNVDLIIKIDMIVVAMFHKVRIPRDVIGQCIAVFDGARILSLSINTGAR